MTRFIRFELQNIEPLRIADDSTSQSGQTNTLKYIPGSTIHGYVINRLAKQADFESIKKDLFSDNIRFMNCFLLADGKELLPPLKGFYEDKQPSDANGEKKIDNVVLNGDFREGMKRASLGNACYPEGDHIDFYHVDTSSDLKIKMKLKDKDDQQSVFRNEYITAGKTFVGYIAVDDAVESLQQRILDSLGELVVLGNGRTSGMGKCRVLKKEILDDVKLSDIQTVPEEGAEKELYMALISNTVMRDERGQFCGLNLNELERKLNVSSLKIAFCATSTVSVKGYNAKKRVHDPSVTMYEQGSVFHLTFEGKAEKEKLMQLMREGIGERRNEGFGQVRFLFQYNKIQKKAEKEYSKTEDLLFDEGINDDATLMLIARNYYRYLIKKAIGEKMISLNRNISGSQVGAVRALLVANQYDPEKAKEAVFGYFGHKMEKEAKQNIQKQRVSISGFKGMIEKWLSEPLKETLEIDTDQIMGFPTEELLEAEEIERLKIRFILKAIQFDNRREGQNG